MIDYTYTNLQYDSMPMQVLPKIVFNNATVSSADNREYIPTQLFYRDCEYLEDYKKQPWIREDETVSHRVVYAIHNRLNGEPHKTIDINFNNTGNEYDVIIWSIPVEDLD